MSVYAYKRPGWMKLAQQKRVNLAQRYSISNILIKTTKIINGQGKCTISANILAFLRIKCIFV